MSIMEFKKIYVVLQTDVSAGARTHVARAFATRKLAEVFVSSRKEELAKTGMGARYWFAIQAADMDRRGLTATY